MSSSSAHVRAPRIIAMQLGAIGTNCYLVHAEGSDQAVIIDPGAEADRVDVVLAERALTPRAILVTHCHWDHIGAVADLAERHELPVYMAREEALVLADLASFAPAEYGPWRSWTVDKPLDGGELLDLAGITFQVLEVPGHSPSHLAYLVQAAPAGADVDDMPPLLFSGDVLFAGSIGRTDLPGADHDTLMRTLTRLVTTLDDATIVLSGHGEPTTIGRERVSNPFLVGR